MNDESHKDDFMFVVSYVLMNDESHKDDFKFMHRYFRWCCYVY